MFSQLSSTPADGTESLSSAAEEERPVQSSFMNITEKLAAAIKSAVMKNPNHCIIII